MLIAPIAGGKVAAVMVGEFILLRVVHRTQYVLPEQGCLVWLFALIVSAQLVF